MAQITAQMVGRTAAPKAAKRGPIIGPALRAGAGLVPLGLLAAAGLLWALPDPRPWWADVATVICGMTGAYLAGRAGYGVPGAEALLAHELVRLEARERDLTRVLVGAALADLPAAGRAPDGGDGAEAPEPRPSAGISKGGRPGVVRPLHGGADLDRPLDDDEALER